MAVTNRDRIGQVMDALKEGLSPFAAREIKHRFGNSTLSEAHKVLGPAAVPDEESLKSLDASALLKLMWDTWNDVFRNILGHEERSIVSELRNARNNWAHQESFSTDDTYRILDSAERLLNAVSSDKSKEIAFSKNELLRIKFEEQARHQRRQTTVVNKSENQSTLTPWRDIITPHADVASGKYVQAEFAADLQQVHAGEASSEYANPVEFFQRTFLTESLKQLLKDAIQRVGGTGGSPVWQLQTNFGGGKTHSMLALYHLMSGTPHNQLLGIDDIISDSGVSAIPKVNRVVLVGTKLSPSNPINKPDGTVVNTFWGEIAWQLGGKEAYELIKADDENATNPGDRLKELMKIYGPCLIFIDEWVAYARQLHEEKDLPGGDFSTHFTFAQALTESATATPGCLLVVSLPSSDSNEAGGERGREALDRLRNVVSRTSENWRPATAEEGFEIVRRRLFEPLTTRDQFTTRDNVAKAFGDFYRSQKSEFPAECGEGSYEEKIKNSYPIHPEIFDRLYEDWSTLSSFQRTRGVLRLMASVIHQLWESGDTNPIILPAHIAMDNQNVQFEITRYLSDNWIPIIAQDIDGDNSLPARLDRDISNLGRISASRKVARTIYLGSAPSVDGANRGIEDRRIKLGTALPADSPAIFGDALRRLGQDSTYLYQDSSSSRFWYDTQPTVTKVASDRAATYKTNHEAIKRELEKRIKADISDKGDFTRIHPFPQSGHDVTDERGARLVVLSPDQTYSRSNDSKAESTCNALMDSKGNGARIYRNSLIFLAPDESRIEDLEESICSYLAWQSIIDEQDSLNLTPNQVRQSKNQKDSADTTISVRLPEAYNWLIVPVQKSPGDSVSLEYYRLTGQNSLAARASNKLKNEELLITDFGSTRLRMDIDSIPLWREDHVAIKQLLEDYGQYNYLSRLKDDQVLINAIQQGLGLLTWEMDTFAYAENYDKDSGEYRGLQYGRQIGITSDSTGLLVSPEAARIQIDLQDIITDADQPEPDSVEPSTDDQADTPMPPKKLRRYHGTKSLNPERVGRDASELASELISHLQGQVGTNVKVTIEIEADIPNGASDSIVRTVLENGNTLGMENHGFEEE